MEEYFGDTKNNLDFVNKDIEVLKGFIINSLDRNDINAHNKWMNNLRDALELKNKLENKTDTYNTFNINVSKDVDIENITKQLTKILNK